MTPEIWLTATIAGANVLLAWYTFRYVRLTRSMIEEMQQQRLASLSVDLVPDGHTGVSFQISNQGVAPATDVQISLAGKTDWGRREGLADLKVIQNGIPYFPGGKTLKYFLLGPNWAEVEKSGLSVDVTLRYKSEGWSGERTFVLDLSQYLSSSVNYRDANLVASAIDRLGDKLPNKGLDDLPFAKAHCADCLELIHAGARKCPHCHTPQPRGQSGK